MKILQYFLWKRRQTLRVFILPPFPLLVECSTNWVRPLSCLRWNSKLCIFLLDTIFEKHFNIERFWHEKSYKSSLVTVVRIYINQRMYINRISSLLLKRAAISVNFFFLVSHMYSNSFSREQFQTKHIRHLMIKYIFTLNLSWFPPFPSYIVFRL